MEKEILEKIYTLRKIKPDTGFVSRTREKIMSKEKKEGYVFPEVFSVLKRYTTSPNFAVVGAFAFIFIFVFLTLPLLPTNYEYAYYLPPVAEENDSKEIPENNTESMEVAQSEEPIENRFDSLKNQFREIQLEVLGTRFNTDNPEEIAKHLIAQAEKKGNKDSLNLMSVGKKEDKKLEKAKEEVEKKNYGEAFDILVDILVEEE